MGKLMVTLLTVEVSPDSGGIQGKRTPAIKVKREKAATKKMSEFGRQKRTKNGGFLRQEEKRGTFGQIGQKNASYRLFLFFVTFALF